MNFTGTIPPHIGNLTFLASLDIGNNSFTGLLPIAIFNASSLKFFIVAENRLAIGQSTDGYMWSKWLDLHGNEFIGEIYPAIFGCSKLEGLGMFGNKFSGSIPREIGNLTLLKELHLGNNE
ncbi:hypothetical protein LguiB_033995 [Lonicera macranthoides]